jgi:hypothetical protein
MRRQTGLGRLLARFHGHGPPFAALFTAFGRRSRPVSGLVGSRSTCAYIDIYIYIYTPCPTRNSHVTHTKLTRNSHVIHP